MYCIELFCREFLFLWCGSNTHIKYTNSDQKGACPHKPLHFTMLLNEFWLNQPVALDTEITAVTIFVATSTISGKLSLKALAVCFKPLPSMSKTVGFGLSFAAIYNNVSVSADNFCLSAAGTCFKSASNWATRRTISALAESSAYGNVLML